MDLRHEIKRQIDHIAQAKEPQRCPLQVTLADGSQVTAQLEQAHSLGCALLQLDIRTAAAQGWDADQLHAIGQRIADRVRYLFEPLQLHEVDAHSRAAKVRSMPPQREGKTVRYFEVTAQAPDGLRLIRYEKSPQMPRRPIPAVVTVEVLAQVCLDITQIASELSNSA